MKTLATTLSLVIVAAGASAAFGQFGFGAYPNGYGYNTYPFQAPATTPVQAYYNGQAELLRGMGQAELLDSEAQKNYQDAISQGIDNHEKYVTTRFELKRANKQYRDSEQPAPLSMSDASRLAKRNAPRRLSGSEVDPVSGRIAWPVTLRDAQYGNYIEQLDELYAVRAAQGGQLDAQTYRQITDLCRDFRNTLKANVKDYSPNEFSGAYRFIESLGREVQVDTMQLAASGVAPTTAVALGR